MPKIVAVRSLRGPASQGTQESRRNKDNKECHTINTLSCIKNQASQNNALNLSHADKVELLASRVLPKYIPSREDMAWFPKLHACSGCGDQFCLKLSLDIHKARLSMNIDYRCTGCMKNLTFFNKCTLISHLKTHQTTETKQTVVDVRGMSVSPLTDEQLSQLPDILVPPLSDGTALADTERHSMCFACGTKFTDSDSLADHLGKYDSHCSFKYKCTKCFLFIPRKCSFNLHERLHNPSTNSLSSCPDCGQLFQTGSSCDQHARYSCLHYSRIPTFKCTCCKGVVFEKDYFLSMHVVNNHMLPYYKCHSCPLAFKTYEKYVDHAKTTHQPVVSTIIYRCPLCEMIFNNTVNNNMREHVNNHIQSMKKSCMFGFKCLICKKFSDNRQSLLQHMERVHGSKPFDHICAECNIAFPTSKILEEHTCHIWKNYLDNAHKDLMQPSDSKNVNNVSFTDKSHSIINEGEIISSDGGPLVKQKTGVIVPKVGVDSDPVSTLSSNVPVTNTQKNTKVKGKHDVIEQKRYNANLKSTKMPRITSNTKSPIKLQPAVVSGKNHDKVPAKIKHDLKKQKSKNKLKRKHVNKYTQTKCVVCKEKFASMDLLLEHLPVHKEHGLYTCTNCLTATFSSLDEVSAHEADCAHFKPGSSKQARFKCTECWLAFLKLSELEEHRAKAHPVDRQYPCHLCGLTYDQECYLTAHISEIHNAKQPAIYKCQLCEDEGHTCTSFVLKIMLKKHLYSKHRLPKNQILSYLKQCAPAKERNELKEDYDSPLHSSEPSSLNQDHSPIKRLRLSVDDMYVCAKCSFISGDNAVFQSHILQHKMNNSIQCLECGLCFAVVPSLKKHLIIVHKLTDFTRYQDMDSGSETDDDIVLPISTFANSPRKDFSQPVVTESEPDALSHKSSNEFECNVCYRSFDDEVTLKKHMRNHGMAFIRSKRSFKPLPETPKPNEDEN